MLARHTPIWRIKHVPRYTKAPGSRVWGAPKPQKFGIGKFTPQKRMYPFLFLLFLRVAILLCDEASLAPRSEEEKLCNQDRHIVVNVVKTTGAAPHKAACVAEFWAPAGSTAVQIRGACGENRHQVVVASHRGCL